MWKCKNGYSIGEDNLPPERCHYDGKIDISCCKECAYYNHEYDLINQAIESAKCRIYRLKQNEGDTLAHQKKAKNQQELIIVSPHTRDFSHELGDTI